MNQRQRRQPDRPKRGHADFPGAPDYLTPLQEQQLVEAWRDGDADALRRLLGSYQRRIFSICYRMLHNVDDAQEIAQDVLLKVFESLETYDGRSKLSTWIIRITMNACVSHIRRAQVRHTTSLHSPREGEKNAPQGLRLALEDAAEPQPASRVEHEELRRGVITALNRLDPDVRALLVLRDVQDLDYDQIAQVLDVPVGTVKSRLFRARAALREELEREKEEL